MAAKEIPELMHCAFAPEGPFDTWLQRLCEQFRRVMAGADATIGLTKYEHSAMVSAQQHNFNAGARLELLGNPLALDDSRLSAA